LARFLRFMDAAVGVYPGWVGSVAVSCNDG
jgi:hypothetical protein